MLEKLYVKHVKTLCRQLPFFEDSFQKQLLYQLSFSSSKPHVAKPDNPICRASRFLAHQKSHPSLILKATASVFGAPEISCVSHHCERERERDPSPHAHPFPGDGDLAARRLQDLHPTGLVAPWNPRGFVAFAMSLWTKARASITVPVGCWLQIWGQGFYANPPDGFC